MDITADNYELVFDPEKPECIQITDTLTGSCSQFTIDEAFAMLKLMLKNHQDLRLLRTGKMA